LGVTRVAVPHCRARLRGRVTAATLVLIALTIAASALGAIRPQVRTQARLDRSLLQDINALRSANGLRPLRASSQLEAAATAHSCEMARDGYFAHGSRNGLAFWRRVRRYYNTRRYRRWQVGENLMWGSPGLSSGQVLGAWLESAEHRENLLNPVWREIGVAAEHVRHGRGLFAQPTTVVTVDFGVRRR
jgi:uncharacterized protein YkwD